MPQTKDLLRTQCYFWPQVYCEGCHQEFEVAAEERSEPPHDPRVGQVVTCPECGTRWAIIWLGDPILLEEIP